MENRMVKMAWERGGARARWEDEEGHMGKGWCAPFCRSGGQHSVAHGVGCATESGHSVAHRAACQPPYNPFCGSAWKITNEVPKRSDEQYLSNHAMFMHI